MDAEDAESLLEWMKEQEELNNDFAAALIAMASLNQSVAEWTDYAQKQQQEIDELKLMVKVIVKSLHAIVGTGYQLNKAFEEEVPVDWQARMTWLTGDHL